MTTTTTATTLFHVMSTTLTSAVHSDVTKGGPASPWDPLSTTTGLLTVTSTTPQPPAQPPGFRPPPPDYLLQAQFVCDQVLIPLVVSVGIVGNLLSLVVLTRKEMTSPTNCFLTALAISDISLLILQIPSFFKFNPGVASTDTYRLFIRYYPVILYVMTNVFLTCTCWLTVAVTVERFLSLRFMMNPRLVFSLPRAKRAILVIFFASFLFHFSKFFEYVPNPDLSSPQPLLPTRLSLNKTYDTAMHIANISLAALLPMAALVVFNSFLIFFLATHRRRMLRYKSKTASGSAGSLSGVGAASVGVDVGVAVGGGGGGGSNSATTTTAASSVDVVHVSGVVVAVVLVFVACHSLGVVVALNIAVHGRHVVFASHLFLALKHVNGLLVTLNSSVNFLVYCSISRKFRSMFASLFLKRCCCCSSPGVGGGGSGGGGGGGCCGVGGGGGKTPRSWCFPLPLLSLGGGHNKANSNNNSVGGSGGGVVLRAGGQANGYTRTSNDVLGAASPTREASFLRASASASNSSGARSLSLNNTLDMP